MPRAEDIGLKWGARLRFRRGGRTRLAGIEIYYDFKWRKVFGNGRSQFRHGQSLAELVLDDCPDGKTPALLLTTRTGIDEEPIHTDSHYVVVVNIQDYLAHADADAAKSYFASRLGRGLTQVARLTFKDIAAWASANEGRMEQLRKLAGVREASGTKAELADVLAALETLDHLDAEVTQAIAALLGGDIDREARLQILEALTADRTGRIVTSEILAERTTDRIADARAAMSAYEALLDDPETGETAMQDFIEKNLWLLGLDYAKMVPQQRLLSGTMDFILERFDGFQDLLELKDPQDPIITVPSAEPGGAAPPPSAYGLSKALAKVLGQVHAYRDRLTRHAEATEDLLGLPHTRDPRLIIVIGRADQLPEHSQRVLTELNKSLHRVEVVPYDLLKKRADAVLNNVEKYLLAAQGESQPDQEAAEE